MFYFSDRFQESDYQRFNFLIKRIGEDLFIKLELNEYQFCISKIYINSS